MNENELKERVFDEAQRLLRAGAAGADAVEVVVSSTLSSTVRFASSVFHQGSSCSDAEVFVRVVSGRRVGVASVNSLERGDLEGCLRRALETAGRARPEPFDVALPGAQEYPQVDSYFEQTASMTYGEKAALLSEGFRRAARNRALVAGSLSTEAGSLFVFNSNGVEAFHPYTAAHLSVVAARDAQSGLGMGMTKDISRMDIPATVEEASLRCAEALSPRDFAPGACRVLLEPPAVAELLYWLSYTGFGAKTFHDGTSFMSDRLGEAVTGPLVTICDDGADPRGLSMPFDMEGVAKRRLPIIDRGVAQAVAYDSFTAAVAGMAPTGNAPFPEDTEGPMPDHIFMAPGEEAAAAMLERLGTGVLVRSFHYVNGLLDPSESLMTGMTRHGAFFVKDGKVRYPVRQMRFTENIMKAFEKIEAVSAETGLLPNHGFALSSISAPHLLIDSFNFTS